jgi:hypothetical protein
MPGWSSFAQTACSPAVNVNGVQGYNCFSGSELYWFAADGSDVRDLGLIALWYNNGNWSQGGSCGNDGNPSQFDPLDGDTWYCLIGNYYFQAGRYIIAKAHYNGSHLGYTSGKQVPDCSLNGGVQPCIQFTVMMDHMHETNESLWPAYQASVAAGYPLSYWLFAGLSESGDLLIYTRMGSQDTRGWLFMYTLGDRTPYGTTASSFTLEAATTSYSTAPLSWCSIHFIAAPQNGWANIGSNDLTITGASGTYQVAITSAPLNTTVGVPGGLNTCPANPFGVTGQVCTAITTAGEPTLQTDGSVLQPTAVGDLIKIQVDNPTGGYEILRILVKNSATSMVVQRGYLGGTDAGRVPGNHLTYTTGSMACGTRNRYNAAGTWWNFRADPTGSNANGSTVIADLYALNTHNYVSPELSIFTAFAFDPAVSPCPTALVVCYQIYQGSHGAYTGAFDIASNPPFAGKMGIGVPNEVDSHPGPCFGTWCFDSRPMLGGAVGTLGSAGSPGVNIGGQLWKFSGGNTVLNRKFLATMAYVGRSVLVDASGPGAVISTGPQDSYKYCYAGAAGECAAGSNVGDVYVNAPYVSYAYCYYPGIAIAGDDTNAICIGDIGAHTGGSAQIVAIGQDMQAARVRHLGPNYAKWNQHDVFWNSSGTPSGSLWFTQVRWFDHVRHTDLLTVLPPIPAPDSIARNTFVPVSVRVSPPANRANNVVVEFGYAENGDPGGFFCTSRQEACVAVSGAIDSSQPFFFERSETYSGASCTAGCTIAIPALSQHVLYYRWKYRDSSGNVVSTSQTTAVAVP